MTVNELLMSQSDEELREHLDDEWLKLAQDAMKSGVSKQEFQEFLEFNKWKQKQ
ncbi:regulator [Gracilibacillus boraciitolerans JCM 21714]|uniref:Regulator n=1 Tax=Gracilibacillus boraciitolerans JCM 21714 TaxID=1298598 RepID=W4VQD2_9BACI|nr:regulator [Gracilibacillus boraciitolerans JCM 21714]